MSTVLVTADQNVTYTGVEISPALGGRISRSGMSQDWIDSLPSATNLKTYAFGALIVGSMVGRYFEITFSNDNATDRSFTLEFLPTAGLTLKPTDSFSATGTRDTIRRYHSRTYRFIGTGSQSFDVYLVGSTVGGSAVNEMKGEGSLASNGTFTLGSVLADRTITFQGTTEFTKGLPNNIPVDHSTQVNNIGLYLPTAGMRAHSLHSITSVAVGATSQTKVLAGKVTGLGPPMLGDDAANKDYVDGKVNGLSWKAPVVAVGSVAVPSPPSGSVTVDSITLAQNDRVLLTAQVNKIENGLWSVATTGNWSRPVDFGSNAAFTNVSVFASKGTVHQDTAWVCSSEGTIGIDQQEWVQFSAGISVTSLNSKSGPLTLQVENSGTALAVDGNTANTLKIQIPSATVSAVGLVDTGNQAFNGTKTFQSPLVLGGGSGVSLSGASAAAAYSLVFPTGQGEVGQHLALTNTNGALSWAGFSPAFGTIKGPGIDLALSNSSQDVLFNLTVTAGSANYFGDFSTPKAEIGLPVPGFWKVHYSIMYASNGTDSGSLLATVGAGPQFRSGMQGSVFASISSVDMALCQIQRATVKERVATLTGVFIVQSTDPAAQLKFVTQLFDGATTPVILVQNQAYVTLERIA